MNSNKQKLVRESTTAMVYRIFAKNESPIAIDELAGHAPEITNIRGDDQGWFQAELHFPDHGIRLELQQFISTEDGIRAELNTWAAWLEAQNHEQTRSLMEHMIQTTRVFTLTATDGEPDDVAATAVAIPLCRFFAAETDGVYQIDGRGFFSADGTLLIAEESE